MNIYRYSLIYIIALVLAACTSNRPAPTPVPIPLPKDESTLSWDRSVLADVYVVYACWTKWCPLPLVAELEPVGTVRQTAIGVTPEFKVYLSGKAGAFAVTARALGGESGFSNIVTFDRR